MWFPVTVVLFVSAALALYRLYQRSLRPVSGNLLDNGSFEDHPLFSGDTGQSKYAPDSRWGPAFAVTWMKLTNDPTTIPSWEVVGTVGWHGGDDSGEFGPADGHFFLDLRNNDERAGLGGVKQGRWLKKDTDYELSVAIGTSPPNHPGPVAVRVDLDNFGGTLHSLPPQNAAPTSGGRQWTPVRWRFDTEGWNETQDGVGVWITIAAPPELNAGKRLVGLDRASLVELRGGIFSRIGR